MKKNSLKNDILEMKKITRKMPKSITEAINFNEEEDYEGMQQGGNQMIEREEESGDNFGNIDKFIDEIRKKSLKGMALLADSPESFQYQTLKKIWQICDKKPEDGQQMAQQQGNNQMHNRPNFG